MKNQEHIVCIKSDLVKHRKNGFVDYQLKTCDMMVGQRAVLENDDDFRQVIPVSVFTYEGKVWAYRRTAKSGESRLSGKVSVCVGGHWDMTDIEIGRNGVIDIESSIKGCIARELDEEVEVISSVVEVSILNKMICCDSTPVDRVHIAPVIINELDGEEIKTREDQLEGIGFKYPQELLNGDYDLEEWAKLVCYMLTKVG